MKTYLVQITVYGFTKIQAENLDEADDKADNLTKDDFVMGSSEIEILDEVEDDT